MSIALVCTHNAASDAFNYYGRWQRGNVAVSINSGALVEFAYFGNSCTLLFDVKGFTHFPAIFTQADNGPIVKTTLSSECSSILVTPQYNTMPSGTPPFAGVSSRCHMARFWIACPSLYQTNVSGSQWTALVGACKFIGINLNGGTIAALPYSSKQIEFLGDSITQGLRLLYTGSDDDTGIQTPYANWPQYVADMLGMKPVVTGFGGQGLFVSGTCGAPPANDAFPYIYDDATWNPLVKPQAVVIYHGTNDGVSPQEFEYRYTAYLTTVRKAYPSAKIFAVCPHNRTHYTDAVKNAVTAAKDAGITFLDYSTGVIAVNETCDGCHLNPGGAVALAIQLARDIDTYMHSLKTDRNSLPS